MIMKLLMVLLLILINAVVLNENQRKAKRALIQENREKRSREEALKQTGLEMATNKLTEHEESLIRAILVAHKQTSHMYRQSPSSTNEVRVHLCV